MQDDGDGAARGELGSLKDELWGTRGEAWAFARGAAVTAILAISIVGCAMWQGWEAQQDEATTFEVWSGLIDTELSLAECRGRAVALGNVMDIVEHDGGLDEIIAYAGAEADTGFSGVSPTNFHGRKADER